MKNFMLFFGTLAATFVAVGYATKTPSPPKQEDVVILDAAPASVQDRVIRLLPTPQSSSGVDATLLEPGKVVSKLTISDKNTVFILGPIGQEAGDIAAEILAKEKTNKELYIAINSPGGGVMDGALIVSAIQQSNIPIYTVCLQLCASEAAVIHAFGTKRYAVDRSLLMYHPAAGGLQGTLPQMTSRLKMITRFTSKTDAYIANRAGLSLAEFQSELNNELWIDAYDATQRHFNDEVVSVTFSVKPTTVEILQNAKKTVEKMLEIE